MVKVCSGCGESLSLEEFNKDSSRSDGKQRTCKSCNKVYRKDNADTSSAYNKAYRSTSRGRSIQYAGTLRYHSNPDNAGKLYARSEVRKAVLRGDLSKGVCHYCGNPNVEAHHPDYTKPLSVIWLCKHHHEEVHHAAS